MDDIFEAFEPLDDGLFANGYDIMCSLPIISVDIQDDHVTYEYEPYTITVSWTNEADGKRTNPHWERVDKQGGV